MADVSIVKCEIEVALAREVRRQRRVLGTVAAVLFGVAVLAALSLVACATPGPVPPIAPDAGQVDAPVPDLFTGRIFDCTGLDTRSAQPYALTCADLENTGECLVDYVNTGVPPALMACAARDAEVEVFQEVARGTASETTRARATRLRAWFWAERMTLRGAP